jgi:Cdc6-like AAA superfamily ATPase
MEATPTQRLRALVNEVFRLAKDRAESETKAEGGYKSRKRSLETEYRESKARATSEFESCYAAAEAEYHQKKRELKSRFQAEYGAAEQEYQTTRERIAGDYQSEKESLEGKLKQTRWEARAVFEATTGGAKEDYESLKQRLAAGMQRLGTIQEEAHQFLAQCAMQRAAARLVCEPDSNHQSDDLEGYFQSRVDAADVHLVQLKGIKAANIFRGFRLPAFFIVIAGVLIVGLGLTVNWLVGVVVGAVGTMVLGGMVAAILYQLAKKKVVAGYQPICQAVADANAVQRKCLDTQRNRSKQATEDSKRKRDEDLKSAEDEYQQKMSAALQRREEQTRTLTEKYPPLLKRLKQSFDDEMAAIEAKYPCMLTEMKQSFETRTRELDERYEQQTRENEERRQREWQKLTTDWKEGMARAYAEVDAVNGECRKLFPDWHGDAWSQWQPSENVPPGMRIGDLLVRMREIPDGDPQDERLKLSGPQEFAVPALVEFPTRSSVLFDVTRGGQAQAELALQAIMLRLVTAIPPAKVRFTIIDPVGLGESFSAFMHLADFDEKLVTNRIWTESTHIEQRLADLTEHMENVIQKYLRNQFETIEQYNAEAGEVAEPFRFLVVANYPVNFTDAAARRLLSVLNSGARCGVYTLISISTKETIPGCGLAELQQECAHFEWKNERFLWKDADFGRFRLTLDAPPAAEKFTDIVQKSGELAKKASKVEVPFEYIIPAPNEVWTSDSRNGIDVPLGRAGATKLQHLRLGSGTSHHVLVAGKTGSGKSTLLHVLITNMALRYGPDEVEVYLIDFKKGVEFKMYAAQHLPHARVVAIESEREFGLSVMQRLDAELRRRGELFREAGVHDIAGYRDAKPGVKMPRIMLLVDEFQEFFIEDDKIAQDASLLMDRLVRQGRAFGIHVMLGSQTLGGAYSLARATIDQMAVRIALQCSEADAHLILSDTNSAARLLSRPGEAIYNDANGLIEGNNPFQIVWLSESQREHYLARLAELSQQQRFTAPGPQIVFEGNAPADLSNNHLLAALLEQSEWPDLRAQQAWLGDAVAIKDPTAAVFRRQSGRNLLVLGQNELLAMGVLGSVLVSLAAQHPPDGSSAGSARFYVLDGSPPDSPDAGTLAKVAAVFPHPVKAAGWRDAAEVFAELAEEIQRRQTEGAEDKPAIYLVIYDLGRFRELRRDEDEFGFSRGDEEKPNPAKMFQTVLKEGSGLGIHTVAWCDSLNNANRILDRAAMREFELRVLFQMSANDSSTLIDTPLASRLGAHRAYFYSEEHGQVEKFRPYRLASAEWLGELRDRFARRA